MTTRPTITNAALAALWESFLLSRNPADLARLHNWTLTSDQIFRLGTWMRAHCDIRPGKESKSLTEALARVDELCAAGKSVNAALEAVAAETERKVSSLRMARKRRRRKG